MENKLQLQCTKPCAVAMVFNGTEKRKQESKLKLEQLKPIFLLFSNQSYELNYIPDFPILLSSNSPPMKPKVYLIVQVFLQCKYHLAWT